MKGFVLMPNSNYIVNLLNLKDNSLSFSKELITFKMIKNIKYTVIHASLSYTPKHCPHCHSKNSRNSIIKHGFKSSDITMNTVNHTPTILRLNKQRFFCKVCAHTFSCSSSIVDKNCFISNDVKHAIALDARKKRSEKDIAIDHCVSHSTVNKIINSYESSFKRKRSSLPQHLSFDEFKGTKDTKGKMAFIMINAVSGEVLDIVDNRTLYNLCSYFRLYTRQTRNKVKTITIDMYTPYMELIKVMFPNAKIICDKFHVVQLISRSLNQTRVQVMKNNTKAYNKFKNYWKLILKCRDDLNDSEYKKFKCFDQLMREIDIVDYLLALDTELDNTYDVYQDMLAAIRAKDYAQFEEVILADSASYSSHMKISIHTLIKYKEYIKNTLTFDYSNGRIEGTNNLIKVIKRIAFGYRRFAHFRTRILIICKSSLNIQMTL